MKRVSALVVAAGLLLACAAPSAAQTLGKIPAVGFLIPGGPGNPPSEDLRKAFEGGLRDLGYVEDQNIRLERHYNANNAEAARDLAMEVLQSGAQVIFAPSTFMVLGIRIVAGSTPIVFAAAADPVGDGLVASLAHPGGTITGLTQAYPDWASKGVQHLKETLPAAKRIAVLRNPNKNPEGSAALVSISESLRAVGLEFQVFSSASPSEFPQAFSGIRKARADAVILVDDVVFSINRDALVHEAMRAQVPLFCGVQSEGPAGCLVTYAPDLTDNFRRAAGYVDKILKGAKPRDLPVEQPTKFELVVNLKTAKALGIAVPQSMILRADEVIE